jgi:hypothetical protein
LSDDLRRRSPLLSDCLWHAWPTADISAEATILLRVAEGGTIVGRARGDSDPPEPALVECLGRLLSVMTEPPDSVGASVSVHLSIGTGGGSLGGLDHSNTERWEDAAARLGRDRGPPRRHVLGVHRRSRP